MRYLSLIFNRLASAAWLLGLALLHSGQAVAQEDLLRDRWQTLESPHFIFYSQLSRRQTERFAHELESWRQAVGFLINSGSALPQAAVPNRVYLFSDAQSYGHFSPGEELAFFTATPRSNFMALQPDLEGSLKEARHHYVHFLVRNFLDLRLPRWYEEGLAAYLSLIEMNSGQAEFSSRQGDSNAMLADLSESIPMDRLLFRGDALVSPRLVGIANLKSEVLLHYLLHGYEEAEFPDRRENLRAYLGYLTQGRNPRFAFDQGFDVTLSQLDEELDAYLRTSRHPAGTLVHERVSVEFELGSTSITEPELAVALAELALNFGRLESALVLFETAIESGAAIARSYSGAGDALRFLEQGQSDQVIAEYFEQALATEPDELGIILDYAEYWESELGDCEKVWGGAQRTMIVEDIKVTMERALVLAPNSPEANLAMAQFYLFEGEDWENGVEYQERAFSILPADGFIMEQSIEYAITAGDFPKAQELIDEMAQPIHFWREPAFLTELRNKLHAKQQGLPYDRCQND